MTDFVDRSGRTTITVLLRLRARSAEDGQMVGHAEVVDTGETVPVRSVEDLRVLLQRLAG